MDFISSTLIVVFIYLILWLWYFLQVCHYLSLMIVMANDWKENLGKLTPFAELFLDPILLLLDKDVGMWASLCGFYVFTHD